MERAVTYDNDDLNLKATELRLGLPGTDEPERETSPNSRTKKRSSSEMACSSSDSQDDPAPATKTQVVGWPPVRSYRKNVLQANKSPETMEMGCGIYVKVSMDGAPYLRKIDLNVYKSYPDLVKGLEKMFKCSNICVYSEREGNMNNGSDYAPTYEDKDGDWMLAGDVPWEMFVNNCKRLRIMKLKDLKLKA